MVRMLHLSKLGPHQQLEPAEPAWLQPLGERASRYKSSDARSKNVAEACLGSQVVPLPTACTKDAVDLSVPLQTLAWEQMHGNNAADIFARGGR
jgi:hypothetical protein